ECPHVRCRLLPMARPKIRKRLDGKLLRPRRPVGVGFPNPLKSIPSFRLPPAHPVLEVVAVEQVATALRAEERQEIQQGDESSDPYTFRPKGFICSRIRPS